MLADGKVSAATDVTGIVGPEGVDSAFGAFGALGDPETQAKILINTGLRTDKVAP